MVFRATEPVPQGRRRWVDGDLSGARFHNTDLSGSRFTGVILDDVEIDGLLLGLTVNGVDVVPLVRAELDRRHPELPLLRSHDPDELREGWQRVEQAWDRTTVRADAFPPQVWRAEVADEWCLADTLRHLVFATDAWVRRPILLEEHPYWPGGLAATDSPPWVAESAGLDGAAAPTVAEIRAVRADRRAILTDVLASVTPHELAQSCRPHPAAGFPTDTDHFTVAQCLHTVLSEEWAHHGFAARDLEILARELAPAEADTAE